MWELLQKLEDLWWKPYWKSIAELTETEKNVRLITSLSSWLWQFVCENKLYKDYNEDSGTYWDSTMKLYNYRDYQYRLIESALCAEDKLEDFILDNVKIDEK